MSAPTFGVLLTGQRPSGIHLLVGYACDASKATHPFAGIVFVLRGPTAPIYKRIKKPASHTRFKRSRSQRQGSGFSRDVNFMRWFPVALLANSVFIATRAGFEPATPVLRVRMPNQYTATSLTKGHKYGNR